MIFPLVYFVLVATFLLFVPRDIQKSQLLHWIQMISSFDPTTYDATVFRIKKTLLTYVMFQNVF